MTNNNVLITENTDMVVDSIHLTKGNRVYNLRIQRTLGASFWMVTETGKRGGQLKELIDANLTLKQATDLFNYCKAEQLRKGFALAA